MSRLACKEDYINWLFSLFEKYGDKDYIGEEVSQKEHMLQAAHLALINKEDNEIVLACLFHDIGHLLAFEYDIETNKWGSKNHEKYGARELRKLGISNRICRLVAKHVLAKKYLAFKNPDYIKKLSIASQNTLIEQGGIMTQQEADIFERDLDFNDAIKVRRYDEQAKVKGMETKPLDFYKNLL
jgi:2-amino-1-hydroxyethylphosphonate dioxygenase (glycine-forming)